MLDAILIAELHQAPLEVALDVTPDSFGLSDETFQFSGNIGGKLTFRLIGHDVSGYGQLKVSAVAPCVRCLEPARCEFSVPVNEVWFWENPDAEKKSGKARRRKSAKHSHFVNAGEDLEDENTFKGDTLDPRETLRELIMSDLPDLPRCRPDCKGLCPQCGVNLNDETCDCTVDTTIDMPINPSSQSSDKSPDSPPEPEWKRAMRDLRGKIEE